MNQAFSVLNDTGSKRKEIYADDAFGQHVALTLRKVADDRNKEFAKVQIQENLFKAQFGLLGIPSQMQKELIPNNPMLLPPFNNTVCPCHYIQQSQNSPSTSPQTPQFGNSGSTYTNLFFYYYTNHPLQGFRSHCSVRGYSSLTTAEAGATTMTGLQHTHAHTHSPQLNPLLPPNMT